MLVIVQMPCITPLYFAVGRGDNVDRTPIRVSASSQVMSLSLVAILNPACCCFLRAGYRAGDDLATVSIRLLILKLATTVEHEGVVYQYDTDVVTNYGHGENINRILG